VEVNQLKVIAFDCDGVLFDSSQANRNYYNHILDQFHLPQMTEAQFAFAHMHTVDETLDYLIRDTRTLAAANQYRRRLGYQAFIGHMVIEPDLKGLLAKLRPIYHTAIATNRTDTMGQVLSEHHLEGQFDLVVTALDVRYPKPHPEALLTILDHFALQPREMVYIGDSELDAMASKRAGVPFIAYANKALEADFHLDRLGQVAHLLNLNASV
jgi:phosphoglycolate phosphatase